MRPIILKNLKDLRDYSGAKTKDCWHPTILDNDPKFAAEFLTIEDSEETLVLMQEVLSNIIREKNNDKSPFYFTVQFSRYNYKWFCSFTNYLEELVLGEVKTSFPELALPEKRERLTLYPPYHVGQKYPILDRFRVKTTDPIDLYRITYIRKNIALEDFRDGFPAWYLMSNSTVFEQYNAVTNTRVRIDFRNGEFRYFLSGASDNWKEIVDIPLEMDHVVSALLFRN